MARGLVGLNEFCEVFVDTPIELAEERDSKGLYRKGTTGELANFTGIDSPYEEPEHIETTSTSRGCRVHGRRAPEAIGVVDS